MSYCELLERAMQLPRPSGPSDGLLEVLVKSRRARDLDEWASCSDVSECLAHQVAYDRALIDISEAMGIETSPDRFVASAAERSRLEHVLADRDSNWSWFIFPDGSSDHSLTLAPAA